MSFLGSRGERQIQKDKGTTAKALSFYNKQMLDYLNPSMREFVSNQDMVFIATADSKGECDCSFRAGPPGFVLVLDDRTLAYPEYKGNGVFASVGNIRENPHLGMVFVDFFKNNIGLHINGKAQIITHEDFLNRRDLTEDLGRNIETSEGLRPQCWILMQVEEAYIHCSKHIPKLKKLSKRIQWGTDKEKEKGGDFFKTKDCGGKAE